VQKIKDNYFPVKIVKILITISIALILAMGIAACSDALHAPPDKSTVREPASINDSTVPDSFGLIPENVEENQQRAILPATPKSRTIMIYMVGSDLESEGGQATRDFIEILESGFNQTYLNVLIYTGGALRWINEVVPNDKNVIYEIQSNGLLKTVRESPALNMGDPETLSEFLTFCYKNYKTDKYDLIFWDHGMGPIDGFGFDELNFFSSMWFMDPFEAYENSILSLMDMSEAMKNSPFDEENKLGFVGFDACFMSSIEVAFVFYEYADYFIASQEVEPGWGWDYAWLGNIKPASTTEAILTDIIDTYFDFCEYRFATNPGSEHDITLSFLNLEYIPDVEESLNMLYAGMADELEIKEFRSIALARSRTKEFGRSTSDNLYDLVDIVHLSELKLKDKFAGAQALSDALDNLIVYNRTNTENANGVSLYYPFSNREQMEDIATLYETFGFAGDYCGFIEQFITLLQGDELTSWDLSRSFTMQESDTRFYIQLTPEQVENFASATFYVLAKDHISEGSFTQALSSTDVDLKDDGRLYANFSGKAQKLLCVESGDLTYCWMDQVERTSNYISYHVRAGLEDFDINRFPHLKHVAGWIQLRTDPDGSNIRLLSLVPEIRDTNGIYIPLPPVDIYEFSKISFPYMERIPTYYNDGNLKPFMEWERPSWFWFREFKLINESVDTFRFILSDIDHTEELYLLFNISDIRGNVYSSSLIPIAFN